MNRTLDFFVIEGIDGAGKTTLSQKLYDQCSNSVLATQPTHGVFGRQIRDVLQGRSTISDRELMDLFVKDRAEQQVWIQDQLKQKRKVILDRYLLSTMAYQGLSIDMEEIWLANRSFIIPEIIFFLDISPELAYERKQNQQISHHDSMEIFDILETQKKIYKNYHRGIQFLREQWFEVVLLDGTTSLDELTHECLNYIKG